MYQTISNGANLVHYIPFPPLRGDQSLTQTENTQLIGNNNQQHIKIIIILIVSYLI